MAEIMGRPSSSGATFGPQIPSKGLSEICLITSDLDHRSAWKHVLCVAYTFEWRGRIMTWMSDSKWIVTHSTLVALLMISWVYIPA